MKKKIASAVVATALVCSFSTSVFAHDASASALSNEASSIQVQSGADLAVLSRLAANDPERINEVLKQGLQVSDRNSQAQHIFEDGSVITLSVNAIPKHTARNSFALAGTVQDYTASVSISGTSSVTGITMWTYTLLQDYKSDGNVVTWYAGSPYSKFEKPLLSVWNLDSEVASTTNNPGYPGGIWATSSIKCSYGIWEVKPQTVNAKLTLSIKGNGQYEGYARFL